MKRVKTLQVFLIFLFVSTILNADEVLFEKFEWGSSLNSEDSALRKYYE